MGLLSPWFLAGLGMLALPVYLHLLKRHKSTPQRFSSLMFFERSTTASVRQRKLDYLLLLALRLALLAFIVFAFSRPFVDRASAAGTGAKLLVAAIDESASMTYGGRLQSAKSQALEVLRGRSQRDPAQVVAFSSRLRILNEPSRDQGVLTAAVESIRPGTGRSSYGELATALRNIARSSPLPLEVHLFTDLQRTSMPPGFSELRLDPRTKLVIHRLAGKDEPNWTVESVTAPRRLLDPKQSRVEAILAGFHTAESSKQVALIVNGRTIATKPVTIPASGKARVEFTGLDAPYGFCRCEIAITEPDGLPADDRALFAVERADPDKVLLLFGPRSQRSALYLRSALETAAPGLFAVDAMAVGAAGSRNLGGYRAIVLSDPGQLSDSLTKALRAEAAKGKGIWIAVGAATTAAGRVPLLDLPIAGSRYEARTGDRFATLGEADLAHPAIRETERWDGVRFYQTFDIQPGTARTVARLTSGAPILLEDRIGDGRVLVFASTFDNDANDFPVRPAFVPFITRAIRWLAAVDESAGALTVDSAFDLRQDGARASSVEVLDPDGNRALSLSEAASVSTVTLDRAGFWEVRRAGDRRELVAVNIDRRESDLGLMPADSAELWQAAPVTTAQSRSSPASGNDQSRKDLWPYVLAFALIAGFAEALVASRHFSREVA